MNFPNVSCGFLTDVAVCASGVTAGDFVKNFKTYVKREIVHQSSLKHPFIVSLKEVSFAIFDQQLTGGFLSQMAHAAGIAVKLVAI